MIWPNNGLVLKSSLGNLDRVVSSNISTLIIGGDSGELILCLECCLR